ncbi:AAA family ATPase [Bacillus spizizenii]|uniref:AAA family ATPase n=1 Tax=Bacillus subtilis group TaxID=653685 RepID=UPI001D0DE5C9|nr:AAA family ATPase [Bacillus halotolerans]MCC2528837.1 AAA family ATPase [Bacillus halotolerans]
MTLKKPKMRNTLTNISIRGYKSINEEQEIELKPLTILAGTNSSGKSSFIQPILLLKQTIEESYDPGALLLNGPLAKFTNFEQLLHKSKKNEADSFEVGFKVDNKHTCKFTYAKKNDELIVKNATYITKLKNDKPEYEHVRIDHDMSTEEMRKQIPNRIDKLLNELIEGEEEKPEIRLHRNRCFLRLDLLFDLEEDLQRAVSFPGARPEAVIKNLIHLPGLRGNPERTYPVTSVNRENRVVNLPGKFERYVASILHRWKNENDEKAKEVEEYLSLLDLTNKIGTKKINDTQIEINVSTNVDQGEDNFVNIADVGLGVSQTLPVLVALVYAKPGQIVYIEQPEIHLHPRGQYIFSQIIQKAVSRGVRVVIETHSSLIIKGIQTEVANKKINHKYVSLNWFKRNSLGETEVNSTELDAEGTFGDWPLDFADVEIEAEMNFIQAGDF